jgi:hypothetical protein
MAKKKSDPKDTRGMNTKGQTVTYKGKQVSFPAQTKVKPTEAITAKGQKATGLAKSGRRDFLPGTSASRAKWNAEDRKQKIVEGVVRTGIELGVGGVVGGAVAKGATVAGRALTRAAGTRQFAKTATATYGAASRGLAKATGEGGKVSRTQTPFGPMLRSTRIGSEAQQAQRMGGLYRAAEKTAMISGARAKQETISAGLKATRKAAGIGGLTAGLAGGKAVTKKANRNKR